MLGNLSTVRIDRAVRPHECGGRPAQRSRGLHVSLPDVFCSPNPSRADDLADKYPAMDRSRARERGFLRTSSAPEMSRRAAEISANSAGFSADISAGAPMVRSRSRCPCNSCRICPMGCRTARSASRGDAALLLDRCHARLHSLAFAGRGGGRSGLAEHIFTISGHVCGARGGCSAWFRDVPRRDGGDIRNHHGSRVRAAGLRRVHAGGGDDASDGGGSARRR